MESKIEASHEVKRDGWMWIHITIVFILSIIFSVLWVTQQDMPWYLWGPELVVVYGSALAFLMTGLFKRDIRTWCLERAYGIVWFAVPLLVFIGLGNILSGH